MSSKNLEDNKDLYSDEFGTLQTPIYEDEYGIIRIGSED